jgi:hypothetical protein
MVFPEYKGGQDYDRSCEFIKRQYLVKNKNNRDRVSYTFTSAVSTESVKKAFDLIMSTVIKMKQ